jgi:hypothetical protein
MRLVPHPWNFAPVGAVALFSGAHFRRRWQAALIPLAAMLASDAVLGFHANMPFVYAGYLAMAAFGWLIRERRTFLPAAGAALAGAVVFFIISNFGYWLLSPDSGPFSFPKTAGGLLACYLAAVPFFPATLAGDLIYTGVLFGGFALAERRVATFSPSRAA